MKCERCGKELSDMDLYCSRCGKAVFPEYMDEEDVWAYYKSDEELAQLLKEEQEQASREKAVQQEETQPEIQLKSPAESVEAFSENSHEKAEEQENSVLQKGTNPEEMLETEYLEEIPETEYPKKPSETEYPEEIPESVPEEAQENIPDEEELLTPNQEEPEKIQDEEEKEDIEASDSQEDEEDYENDEEEDEEDEEDEERKPLTPEKKRARWYTALLASVFLLLCLGAGIFFGIRRMNQLDALEQEYDKAQKEKADTQPVSLEAGNLRLLPEETDLSQYTKVQPGSAEADSQKQSEEDYSGSRVIDGDQATSWQEGEEGTGEGKGVVITLDGSHTIRYMVLYLGNWKSDELWSYNARPKSLSIQIDDGEAETIEFPEEKRAFYLAFQEPGEASRITVRIQDSYQGERWEDNCISEIELYE